MNRVLNHFTMIEWHICANFVNIFQGYMATIGENGICDAQNGFQLMRIS